VTTGTNASTVQATLGLPFAKVLSEGDTCSAYHTERPRTSLALDFCISTPRDEGSYELGNGVSSSRRRFAWAGIRDPRRSRTRSSPQEAGVSVLHTMDMSRRTDRRSPASPRASRHDIRGT